MCSDTAVLPFWRQTNQHFSGSFFFLAVMFRFEVLYSAALTLPCLSQPLSAQTGRWLLQMILLMLRNLAKLGSRPHVGRRSCTCEGEQRSASTLRGLAWRGLRCVSFWCRQEHIYFFIEPNAFCVFLMCGELLLTFYFILLFFLLFLSSCKMIIYQMNCGVHLQLTQSPRWLWEVNRVDRLQSLTAARTSCWQQHKELGLGLKSLKAATKSFCLPHFV